MIMLLQYYYRNNKFQETFIMCLNLTFRNKKKLNTVYNLYTCDVVLTFEYDIILIKMN